MNSRKIIIWGKDNYNALGLLRQLSVENNEVLFMVHGGAGGCATKSRYCKDIVVVNTLEEGRDFFLKNYPITGEKAIIICSGDEVAEYLDIIQSELSSYYIVPGAREPGMIAKMTDKYHMTRLAEDIGFDIPQTIVCKWDTDISEVKFPCILKPTHQQHGHYNEFKFKICKNASQLKRTLRFVRRESEFLLQQYIAKEKDILVYGARMMDQKVCLAGALIRDRFCGTGESSHGLITPKLPACVDAKLIEKYLERINYHGLFSVEYGWVGDKSFFFEFNFRNDGTSHFFYQAGANIPLAWVYSSLGLDYSLIPTIVHGEHYYIDEIYDIQNVKEGKISKKKWEKEKAEATIFKYYDEQDMEPYFTMKKGLRMKLILDGVLSRYRIYIVWILDRIGVGRK